MKLVEQDVVVSQHDGLNTAAFRPKVSADRTLQKSVVYAVAALVASVSPDSSILPNIGNKPAHAFNTLNQPRVTEDTVDLVEINHFYDELGRLVFDQIIYYNWDIESSRYQVVDWRLIKNESQLPMRNWKDGGYTSEWEDFLQNDSLRRVHAKAMRETWTTDDPELKEREILPQKKRKLLTPTPRRR